MKTIRIIAALVALASATVYAQKPEKADTKAVMDFAFQGLHMFFTRALDGGHYEREGLNVAIDRGYGSVDTVTKIAARVYDFGFADTNVLVKFNAEHPDTRVLAVLLVLDRSLNGVIGLKSNGINKPTDLVGKTIAGSEGDSARLMFPLFARAVRIDAATVKWQSVAANLREAMVVKKQAHAMTAFASTAFFNLQAAGAKADDIVIFTYADFGLDLPGHAVIVREDFAAQNPGMVGAFVRGTVAGMQDAIKDKNRGIASIKKRDPLIKEALELDRYNYIAEHAVFTDNVRKNGLGAIDTERLSRSIAAVAESFSIKSPPTPDQVATTRFLPPRDKRTLQ